MAVCRKLAQEAQQHTFFAQPVPVLVPIYSPQHCYGDAEGSQQQAPPRPSLTQTGEAVEENYMSISKGG